MIDATISMDAAGKLAAPALIAYLRSTGWDSRPSRVVGITIFSKNLAGGEEPIQFILPESSEVSDVRHRIADALRVLEAVEGRPIDRIVRSVHQSLRERPSSVRFIAIDKDDLEVLSAHLQDAVLKVSDINWFPAKKELTLVLSRFDWESSSDVTPSYQRRRAALRFQHALSLSYRNIDPANTKDVLNLLAFEVSEDRPPKEVITFIFSGGAALRLEVESIEAELVDLDVPRSTLAMDARMHAWHNRD